MAGVHDFDVTTIDGRVESLDRYRGRTLLIVNVASQCGYTPQYAGLERMYRAHQDQGLVVLGFPCNQFGGQEPGSEDEIQGFCKSRYDVTFPMFAKVRVNGDAAHPLFQYLKSQKKGVLGSASIKWNFTKFLVGPDGDVLERFGPGDTPEKIERALAVRGLVASVQR
jgi:glutathione peroxidase